MNRHPICSGIFTVALLVLLGLLGFGQQALSTDIVGGRGGRQFADLDIPTGAKVTEVHIRSGDHVDSVQLLYTLADGNTQMGTRHGGSGGQLNVFRLDSDEYITGISGRYGDIIDSICVQTNKRTSSTFGGRGGRQDFRVEVLAGNQGIGFTGRAGDYLDAIGLTYTPLSILQANEMTIAGGTGGTAFSDSDIPQGARISEIRVRSGDRIDSIQVIYTLPNGSVVEGAVHGGRGGSSRSFSLDSDEYIIGLSGRSGDQIDSLRIHTNKRTSPTFGGRGGNKDYKIDVPSGSQAIGFNGRAGRYLNAVGLNSTATNAYSRQIATRRRSRQAETIGGETIAASPSSCNIPRGSNRCSVTVQVTNPNRRSVQLWARGPLDSQEKAVSGIFTDAKLGIVFEWVYQGTVTFNLYEVSRYSKTALATATAIGVATRSRP